MIKASQEQQQINLIVEDKFDVPLKIRMSIPSVTEMGWIDLVDSYGSIAKNFETTEGLTSVYYKGKVFFFGGALRTNHPKIYFLDIKRMSFGILKPKNFNPLNRCFHTAVLYKDSMIIHGGEAGSEAMT